MSTSIQKIIERVNRSVNAQLADTDRPIAVWDTGHTGYQSKAVEEWTLRDFVLYFKDIYFKVHNQDYVITYAIDNPEMQKMKSTLVKSGFSKKTHLKNFLDWCYDNRDEILAKRPDFMLHDPMTFVNNYIQSTKTPGDTQQIPDDSDFIERIKKKIAEGTSLQQLLEVYGIPIVASYLKYISNKEDRIILINIEKIIYKNINDKKITVLKKIAKQSINMSPYDNGFILLNWRDQYKDIWDKLSFYNEDWWRKNDYNSKVPSHYTEIVEYSNGVSS